MNSGNVIGFFYLGLEIVGLAWMICTQRGRDAFRRLLREMRRLYVIHPLRVITGRRAPDYRRIRELERLVTEDTR